MYDSYIWDLSTFKIKLSVAVMEKVISEQTNKWKIQIKKQNNNQISNKSRLKRKTKISKKKKNLQEAIERQLECEGSRYQRGGNVTISK